MNGLLRFLKPWVLHMWAILIAVVLWLQVHGQGEGSLSMEVPLQMQGLPENMVIVNDLPNQVRITVQGLQARLKGLKETDIFVPLIVSDLSEPGVIERPLSPSSIRLPAGLVVEKMQPDRLELQVDRIVTRTLPIRPQFDLPQSWHVNAVYVEPANAGLQGAEVWLESLTDVETVPLRLELKNGAFEIQADIVTPTGKAVHLEQGKDGFVVRGILSQDTSELSPLPALETQGDPQ